MAKMTMNGGQINVKWEAGKMVVFDDSFEHEVLTFSFNGRRVRI